MKARSRGSGAGIARIEAETQPEAAAMSVLANQNPQRIEMTASHIPMQALQRAQHDHDLKHHFDILSLSRADRLKHYGLHFAKYAGRFARGSAEPKTRAETLVDAFLVVLSAANALNQALPEVGDKQCSSASLSDLVFTDQAGRFADACEKIDHLEDFRSIAIDANAALLSWIICNAREAGIHLDSLIQARRAQLARRAVYAQEN